MFTVHLAWRYAFSKSNRHRNAALVIMAGIAVGMLAIIIMLSLMNSLQEELLEQVKSIESFHLQVSFPVADATSLKVADVAGKLEGAAHVVQVHPYVNTQVLVQDVESNRYLTARLRLVDDAIWHSDNPFSRQTRIVGGTVGGEGNVSLGSVLALKLAWQPGDTMRMTILASGRAVVLAPMTVELKGTGAFVSGLPEFDESTMIGELSPLEAAIGPKRILYGLYLDEQTIDRQASVVRDIKAMYPTATVRTWQQVNSAFHSALMLEKVLMYLFLFFMFVILGVNMRNASSRLLHAKQRELAILRAVGSGHSDATRILLGQAAIVTLIGEVFGVAGGVLLGKHIGRVFGWMNSLQYLFTRQNNLLLSYPFTTTIRASEVVVIFLSVLALSLGFTYLGCRRTLHKEPMEMLYHD